MGKLDRRSSFRVEGIAGSVDSNIEGSSGSSVSELSPVSFSISHRMSLMSEDTENRASISLSFTGFGILEAGVLLPPSGAILSILESSCFLLSRSWADR